MSDTTQAAISRVREESQLAGVHPAIDDSLTAIGPAVLARRIQGSVEAVPGRVQRQERECHPDTVVSVGQLHDGLPGRRRR